LVSALLAAGAAADPKDNLEGMSALAAAAGEGYTQVVSLLLTAGAAADTKDSNHRTALAAAAAKGHTQVVSLQPRSVASSSSRGRTGWLSWWLQQ
jgi:ankyrin repeat protein